MSRIRLLPAISGLILTFLLLFGGYQMYRSIEIVQPLQSQLKQIHAVNSAQVVTIAQSPAVVVTLGKVTDLQTTYTQIQAVVLSDLGNSVPITINDRRDAALTATYEAVKPIIYQGIAHGNYVSMINSFESACRSRGVDCKISMNSQDIFVQMMQKNAYLYAIVPYSIKSSGVNS